MSVLILHRSPASIHQDGFSDTININHEMYSFKPSIAKAKPFYYVIECFDSETQDETRANMSLARLFYANHNN